MNMDIIINGKDASIVIHATDRLQIFKQAYHVIDNLSSKDPQKHETLLWNRKLHERGVCTARTDAEHSRYDKRKGIRLPDEQKRLIENRSDSVK
jgi:hypothetical protein